MPVQGSRFRFLPDNRSRRDTLREFYGPFLATQAYPEIKFILKFNPKTGAVELPKSKGLRPG